MEGEERQNPMPEDGNRHRQLAKLVDIDRTDGRCGGDSNSGAAETMADILMQLRQYMDGSGLTTYAIAKQSGVSVDSIYRFRAGTRDLTFAAASKVADALGLKLVRADGGDVGKTGPKAKASPKKPKAAAKKATPKRTKQRTGD